MIRRIKVLKNNRNYSLWHEKICAYCGKPMFLNILRQHPTATNRKCHKECANHFLKINAKPRPRFPTFGNIDVGAYMSYQDIANELKITPQGVFILEKTAIRKFIKRLREKYTVQWNEFKKEFESSYQETNESIMIVYLLLIYFAAEVKRISLTKYNDQW